MDDPLRRVAKRLCIMYKYNILATEVNIMSINWDALSHMPLFYGIDVKDMPSMLQCLGSYKKQYLKNEFIFLEGENIQSIGIILSGTVHMIKEDYEGNSTLLVCMKEGELFGETFACGVAPDSKVSFLTTTLTTVLFLPFSKVIHSCQLPCTFHHRLIENMVRLISIKNVQLMNKVEIVSKKTLRDKILTYLYLQAELKQSDIFTIPFGRQELANYLCADRSALARELSLMQQEQLIKFDKNTFEIL